ncbi:MFS transporter [Rhizomicrobium electricum]|jgi:maltose/moltooligosaccharide transporter|uniref:MFS transporter n=1 Tax=Rhizomicrobium electricum TaxID=480070 RepID=A0ABN1EYB1_9PROT|nr:MFS transporter [Rhizomicrobium electricum]NIJ49854.1 maltose/moltooligosaccharide transporter [Rhizomicrobium electricum]
MASLSAAPVTKKPSVTFFAIWNMCFGFLGLQFGLGLQNANVSRIFQTLGAKIDDIPILWIAAPLTGLLVQPLVGYLSDRTWTRLGRRRPYLLVGALLSSAALLIMPMSPALWVAAVMLWILDASINTSMQPFRAFVGDQLPLRQRPAGYAMQSFFIGVGAVVASALPWLFEHIGISNTAQAGIVPDTVRYSFFLGAIVLFVAVLWTVISTHEYPPEQLEAFDDASPELPPAGAPKRGWGAFWLVVGVAGFAVMHQFAGAFEKTHGFPLDKQLYLLWAGAFVWGAALLLQRPGEPKGLFGTIMRNIETMPDSMRKLAPVQFFSWLALFAMWIYTTGGVTESFFHSKDATSAAYNEGANWVGILFAAYNGFAALASIIVPWIARKLGLRWTHLINVWLGGFGLLSFLFIHDPDWLIASMLGVGFAWASILSLPYAIVSDSVPAKTMGVYMGIFNFFIVIPQLVAASVLGFVLKFAFHGQPIYALAVGGVSFLISGLLVLRLPKEKKA